MVSTVPVLVARAALRWAKSLSIDADPATSLLAKLEAMPIAGWGKVSLGQIVSSVAAQGHSTSFAESLLKQFSPLDILGMWEELIDFFNDTYTNLGGTPTDTEVFDEMVALMKPCREYTADHSLLRVGPAVATS